MMQCRLSHSQRCNQSTMLLSSIKWGTLWCTCRSRPAAVVEVALSSGTVLQEMKWMKTFLGHCCCVDGSSQILPDVGSKVFDTLDYHCPLTIGADSTIAITFQSPGVLYQFFYLFWDESAFACAHDQILIKGMIGHWNIQKPLQNNKSGEGRHIFKTPHTI